MNINGIIITSLIWLCISIYSWRYTHDVFINTFISIDVDTLKDTMEDYRFNNLKYIYNFINNNFTDCLLYGAVPCFTVYKIDGTYMGLLDDHAIHLDMFTFTCLNEVYHLNIVWYSYHFVVVFFCMIILTTFLLKDN